MRQVSAITATRAAIDERVSVLMSQLDSLLGSAEAAAHLVACGAAAIGPLREFLLHGQPRGVYQPRVWAVRALAGLGADDVLVDYLQRPIVSDDAVGRFGEHTVRSEAAKALASSDLPEVRTLLFDVARRERLPGALEAIASRDPDDAVPILITALEGDFVRDTAQAALRRQGIKVRDALIDAALDEGTGSESALRRRRAALGLLEDIGIDAEAWRRLERLLDEEDATLVCAVGALGVALSTDPARIARRLLEMLPHVGWDWCGTLEDTVVQCVGRAGVELSSLLPMNGLANDGPGAHLSWRRICRRVARARDEAAGAVHEPCDRE